MHSSGKQYEVYVRCMARRILVELDVAASVSHVLMVLIIIIIFGIHRFSFTVVNRFITSSTTTAYYVQPLLLLLLLLPLLLVGERSSRPQLSLNGWPDRLENSC